MIHTSPTISLAPIQYRHTSYLRGCGDELDERRTGKGSEGNFQPLYSLSLRSATEKQLIRRGSSQSLSGHEGCAPSADSHSIRSSPYSTQSEASLMTTTMSLAPRGEDAAMETDSRGSQQRQVGEGCRSPPVRKADSAERADVKESQRRLLGGQRDLEHRAKNEAGAMSPSARLPGIAHLDRHMPLQWNSGRYDAREDDRAGAEYHRSTHSTSAHRETDIHSKQYPGSDRRYGSEIDDRRPNHFSAPRYPSNSDRSGYVSSTHGAADRLPNYRSMYKRSDSPSTYREYERDADGMADGNSVQEYGRGEVSQPTTWPSSPSFKREEEGNGYPYTSSYNGSSRGSLMHMDRAAERSSLPPLQSRSSSIRADGYPNRSPPSRTSYDAPPRGLGLATEGVLDQYTYGGRGSVSGAPRSSGSSLRSLSMSYPYEPPVHHVSSGTHRGYHDAQPYDDGVTPSRHNSISNVHHISSPRHHPYAQPAGPQGMPAPSYGDHPSIAGEHSPNSMPRRRGKLPKPVTDLLKTWLLDHAAHPYPTEDEKRRLCAATGLSISQVSNWFINARRRILVPQGSGHFGVAPSTAAVGEAGGADLSARRSSNASHQVLHPPPYHPHPDSVSAYAPPPSSHHHTHSHPQAYEHAHHLSHPPPPSSGRHAAGMPLGPPPLPSHHHHYGGGGGARMAGQGGGYGRPPAEHYSRSAEHSPIVSHRRESP